jgi:hypothetical protein
VVGEEGGCRWEEEVGHEEGQEGGVESEEVDHEGVWAVERDQVLDRVGSAEVAGGGC